MTMNVESRDSDSLKPAELDEFSQLLTSNGLSLTDAQLDLQVEAFPLAVVAMLDSEVQGLMLGSLERIPIGEGRTFAIEGLQIAVFRPRSGEVFATQASCPHANGPLADGLVGNGKVVCPFHSYKFDLATGCPEGNSCAPLTTYPAGLTSGGDVVVTLGGR